MGTDLIIYSVLMHGISTIEKDMNARRDRMFAELDGITKNESIQELINEFYSNIANGDYNIDDLVIDILDEDPKEDAIKEIEVMKAIISHFFDCLGNRDVTLIEVGNDIIWVTGGMTWGDTPTDSTPKFEMFRYLPDRLLDAGGFE